MVNNSQSEDTQVMTLEVGPDEPLVLPQVLKTALGLDDGGAYTAVNLDGVVMLVSRPLESPRQLEQMRQALEEEGVTLEDLLDGLADVRARLLHERYGLSPSS